MGSVEVCAPIADANTLARPTVTTAVAPRASPRPRLGVMDADVPDRVLLRGGGTNRVWLSE